MIWQTKQFWLDSLWRAFRTFCQSLAGLLLAVQSSNQIAAMPEISVPWYGYLYSSGVAALISLLQSIDRERVAVNAARTAESSSPVIVETSSVQPLIPGVEPPPVSVGCGDALR